MWGDFGGEGNESPGAVGQGGEDRFVFLVNNGQDIIYDFRPDEGDKIDLRKIDDIQWQSTNWEISQNDGSSIIHFDNDNTITVIGVTGLSETDFIFATA